MKRMIMKPHPGGRYPTLRNLHEQLTSPLHNSGQPSNSSNYKQECDQYRYNMKRD